MKPDPGMFEDKQARNDREVEQWLSQALSQYGSIEPRPGLEGRVLACLSAENSQRRSSPGWWRVFAFSMAVMLALALFWFARMDFGRMDKGQVEIPVAKHLAPPHFSSIVGSGTPPRLNQSVTKGGGSNRTKVHPSAQPGTQPKLETFPSATPLNDQEKILALYVRRFPERAALVARAQTDLRRRDELEQAAP
jgi:hypothetical protein